MQPLRLAVVIGAPLLATIAVLVACEDNAAVPIPSTSSSTSGAPNKGTSSSGSTGDDDDDTKATDDDDDDTAAKDGGTGDADCTFAPSLHHTDAGFFCDHYDGGPQAAMAGGKKNCATGMTCCNPAKGTDGKFPNSYCADGLGVQACDDGAGAAGSTWAPGTAWECAAASNCSDGKKCCAVSFDDAVDGGFINYGATPAGTGAPPAACHAKTLFKVGGTKCSDDCDPKTAYELCSLNDKCSNGKACVAVASGTDRDLGVCPR